MASSVQQPRAKSKSRYRHVVLRCKYCTRRFVGNRGRNFFFHVRNHERPIRAYWYGKKRAGIIKRSQPLQNEDVASNLDEEQTSVAASGVVSQEQPLQMWTDRATKLVPKLIVKRLDTSSLSADWSDLSCKITRPGTGRKKTSAMSEDHIQQGQINNNDNGSSENADITQNKDQNSPSYRFCTESCKSSAPCASKKSAVAASSSVKPKAKKRYHCQYCPRCFAQNGGLVIHERIHRGENPFRCTVCDKAFNDNSNLRKHSRIHTGDKIYKCEHPDCGSRFSDPGNLKKHFQTAHGDKNSYRCSYCNQELTSYQGLQQHEHQHKHAGIRPYRCRMCDKAFARRQDQMVHEMIHSGERPHRCDFEDCEAAFIRADRLTVHKRLHTGERPYKCNFCDSCYTSANRRRMHELAKHSSTPKPLYKCTFCEKTYTTKAGRFEHEGGHTGQIRYKCGVCGYRFVKKDSLKYHMKTWHKVATDVEYEI